MSVVSILLGGLIKIDININKLICMSIIYIIIIIISEFLVNSINKNIIIGATTKEVIDRKLFNFKITDKDLDISEKIICKKSRDIKYKYTNEYKVESNTTGIDKERGVKDWYENTQNLSLYEAIFKCQKENINWDEKISKIHFSIITFVFIITFLLCLIISISAGIKNNDMRVIIPRFISFMPLYIILVREICSYFKLKTLINDIETQIYHIEKCKHISLDDLEDLQHMIYLRRKNTFAPFYIIHKVISKKYHLYRKATS